MGGQGPDCSSAMWRTLHGLACGLISDYTDTLDLTNPLRKGDRQLVACPVLGHLAAPAQHARLRFPGVAGFPRGREALLGQHLISATPHTVFASAVHSCEHD